MLSRHNKFLMLPIKGKKNVMKILNDYVKMVLNNVFAIAII